MGKSLVIVESPAKAKTINKILGSDYIVRASMGHVRDLPVNSLGVDIEKGFEPKYVIVKGREKPLRDLRTAAADCDALFLAPDPDREGEAIAWHLAAALADQFTPENIHRVTYNEITPRAIREAFSHPRDIDQHRVDAQQARRILDRLVGYRVSPLLWSRLKGGLSAGRVQSVALRLVCEREKEILAFVPEDFWLLGARACKLIDPRTPFELRLSRIDGEKADVRKADQAEGLLRDLQGRSLRVSKLARREMSKKAFPPYITSTLQQAGSRVCGFSPQRTMSLAQRLYEGVDLGEGTVGLITYMRTDSLNVAADAIQAVRAWVGEHYGADYVPEAPNVYRSRSSAQEAHEAIRPTDVTRTPDAMRNQLGPEELRLYRLIWQRFVASQMAPARIEQLSCEVEAVPAAGAAAAHTYLFRASSSRVVFPGYMRAAGVEETTAPAETPEDEDEARTDLPPLREGESLECLEWLSDARQTQPPGRFSEASLVRALEENGIGRPSTYAQILTTLAARKYVRREKRTLHPSDLGMQVSDLLVSVLADLFDVQFTARMEEELDAIEAGTTAWREMLKAFHDRLDGWLREAKGPPADRNKAERILKAFDAVEQWQPPEQRGGRAFGDERFVRSIAKQASEGNKPLSQKQLTTLAQLALRYEKQIPGIRAMLTEMELDQAGDEQDRLPPRDSTLRKLQALVAIEFDPPRPVEKGRAFDDREFVQSVRRRVEGGRRLTLPQLAVLDRIVVKYRAQIPDFEKLEGDLEVQTADLVGKEECLPLLQAFAEVREWAAPVQRGRRLFDDQAFYASLNRQAEEKGGLSDRQFKALKRMAGKYRTQLPGFAELAQRYELRTSSKKGAADAEEAAEAPDASETSA